MTITVSGLNYLQIAACEAVSGDTGVGGNWSGDTPVVDSATAKQGTYSMSFVIKSNTGIRYGTFTPTSSVDLSGTKHVRFWFLSTLGSNLKVKASGGIMFYATDGSNTGYWNLDGRDTYAGGWKNMVVDVSRAVDSGTKPTNMNAITAMGIAMQLDVAGKNVATTWVDNLTYGDGLVTYGDDAGGYYGFQGIYDIDNNPSTGGWGIITKLAGVFFVNGALRIGDASGSSATKFQATSQTVVFEDRGSDTSTSLYGIDIVDNGTGTTEFILGEKSGTAGISGCTIRVDNTSQTTKFWIDAATDTDVDNFKLYGSTFLDASTVKFPPSGANVEVLNCSFESCGTITPSTAKVENCTIVAANNVGMTISSTSHGIKDCTFISCPNALQVTTASTSYSLNNVRFIGGDGSSYFDVENTTNATTCDSYAESNQDTDQNVGNDTSNAAGQSFTGNGGVLSRARLWLKKVNSPTGNAVCKIYASTGSDPNRTPTGAALATSNTVAVSGIGASYGAIDFEFEDEYTLTNSTTYFLVLEYDGDSSNYLHWGTDTSSPGHTSNNFAVYTTGWAAASTTDGCFYVYTGGIVKIGLSNGSNPAYDNNTGTPPGAIIMPQSIILTIRGVKSGKEPDSYVRVLIEALAGGYEDAGTQLMLEVANQTDEINSGYYKATESYKYVSSQPVKIVARHKGYKQFVSSAVITGSDLDVTAVWQEDTTVDLP